MKRKEVENLRQLLLFQVFKQNVQPISRLSMFLAKLHAVIEGFELPGPNLLQNDPVKWLHQFILCLLYIALLLSLIVSILRRRRRRLEGASVPLAGGNTAVGDATLRRQRLESYGDLLSQHNTMQQQRPRLGTTGSATDLWAQLLRQSQGSQDLDEEDDDFFQLWQVYDPVQESSTRHYVYRGPAHSSLVYETWGPPPTWAEASHYVILPSELKQSLIRHVHLALISSNNDSLEPMLRVDLPNSDQIPLSNNGRKREPEFQMSISQVGIHVQQPVEGAVVNIYVKESTRSEWIEQTFSSAQEAAQFQLDLLALQLFGSPLLNMFQALQIIHLGSMAHSAPEFVLHDNAWQGSDHLHSSILCGIAWDDVMRSLGSAFPSIRLKLEALWWWHTAGLGVGEAGARAIAPGPGPPPSTGSEIPVASEFSSGLTDDYVKKRLLLGPIDFFRLFVPQLGASAMPRADSSPRRMEQLLRYRKRVARAAVLVNAYVKARRVVNQGWTLLRQLPEIYWKRRLAFDDDIENRRRDQTMNYEYYEPTVSRDVFIHVRGLNSFPKKSWWFPPVVPSTSMTQGYALVGFHKFQLPRHDDDFPLHPTQDPVMALPSLRELIDLNPDQHFIVISTFSELRQHGSIMVFVRSLAKGIDRSFDTTVRTFLHQRYILSC